jgi:hypothetical protein
MSKMLKGTGWMIGLMRLERMRTGMIFRGFEETLTKNGNGYKQRQVRSN